MTAAPDQTGARHGLTLFSRLLGLAAALGAGALSGVRIGKEALGAELAADMAGRSGIIGGGVAVVLTALVLSPA